MPDYLDGLVASLNGFKPTAEKSADDLDDLRPAEAVQEPAEPPGATSGPNGPGPAGGREERREEVLDVPEGIRAEPEQQAAVAAGGSQERPEERLEVPPEIRAKPERAAVAGIAGGSAAEAGEPAGHAAGPVDGRMMAVMPEERGQGIEALVTVVQGIAMLGLPAGGAATHAIGSKI